MHPAGAERGCRVSLVGTLLRMFNERIEGDLEEIANLRRTFSGPHKREYPSSKFEENDRPAPPTIDC
jgi:hypothetical protein